MIMNCKPRNIFLQGSIKRSLSTSSLRSLLSSPCELRHTIIRNFSFFNLILQQVPNLKGLEAALECGAKEVSDKENEITQLVIGGNLWSSQ